MPCPRMNAAVALRGNTLFLLGGLYEPEEQAEITLNDLWSLDLAKMDGWLCLHAGNAPDESVVREESEDDDESGESGESDEETTDESGSSDGDGDGGGGDDRPDDGGDEDAHCEKAAAAHAQRRQGVREGEASGIVFTY